MSVNLTEDESSCFALLHPALRRWIALRGWKDLHPVQKQAIKPVLAHDRDVIISASTASGKTEAAFFPVLTYLKEHEKEINGAGVLYISPLKALINDQCRRLSEISEPLGIKVTPWHGDVGMHVKNAFLKKPSGIVLITPESLESLLISRTSLFKEIFSDLAYIVIDEFHALMSGPRGYQLQSQLHRIDNLIRKLPVRIAISATFSNDIGSVSSYLRNSSSGEFTECEIISPDQKSTTALAVRIIGYRAEPDKGVDSKDIFASMHKNALVQVAADVFRLLRGRNNLVFTNSRADAEILSGELSALCRQYHVPEEFFPHHGSLSKEIRETLEHRLQEGRLPTTALCTSTLELGIDISDVSSIAQVSPPASVASLRQRLGRSGRRDGRAVLRLFIPENSGIFGGIRSALAEDTVLSAAMINLVLKRWYEPPLKQDYAFSTLIQQTLSVIASSGGVSAAHLYELLCETGPFSLVSKKHYALLLRSLGTNDLIMQMKDGNLVLGIAGEYLVSEYEFFAAFSNDKEFRVEHDGRVIGRLPLLTPLSEGDTFLFAGHGWRVVFLNQQKRILSVRPFQGRTAELPFGGVGGLIHDGLREEMYRIYMTGEFPDCLNEKAEKNLEEGRQNFFKYGLDKRKVISTDCGIMLFPWKGDRVLETVVLLLKRYAVRANRIGSHIETDYISVDNLKNAIGNILQHTDTDPAELLRESRIPDFEKFNVYLPDELRRLAYAHSHLDIEGAAEFFRQAAREL